MLAITLDNPWDYQAIADTLKSFNSQVYVRVVIDPGVEFSEYIEPFVEISKVVPIMALVSDSFVFKNYTVEQYRTRVEGIHKTLGKYIKTYEIANEINGDWLGDNVSSKVKVAQEYIIKQKLKNVITLYSDEQQSWRKWMITNKSLIVKADWILLSEYPYDNNGYRVNFSSFMRLAKSLNSKAKIGFGECGTSDINNKATEFDYYYLKQNKLYSSDPRFLGGFFWWYQTDFVSDNPLLLAKLKAISSPFLLRKNDSL